MIETSKLSYMGIVALLVGVGLLLLTTIRGLSTFTTSSQFSVPKNTTTLILPPATLSPRNCKIWLYADAEVDLLILDSSEYTLFLNGKKFSTLMEYRNLKNSLIELGIPSRKEYYFLVRNLGTATINGEIIVTFFGFEKDLFSISLLILSVGFLSLVLSYVQKLKATSNRVASRK
ncbi:MAG: hypothetical protein ACP5KW_10840, partial [Thermoproteota archaeon]